MKDYPCICGMQISRGAILLIVRKIYCKKVPIQHIRILTSVITGEIRLFLGCTYQPKGKEKTEVSSNLYNPSGDLSVTAIQVICINQIKRFLSAFLFMPVFYPHMGDFSLTDSPHCKPLVGNVSSATNNSKGLRKRNPLLLHLENKKNHCFCNEPKQFTQCLCIGGDISRVFQLFDQKKKKELKT